MNRRDRRKTAASDTNWAADLNKGLSDHKAGRLDAAERAYRRIPSRAPEAVEALHWLGVLAHQRGQDQRALRFLRQSAERQPDNPVCLHHLGEVARAAGQFEEAVAAYRKALPLARDPGDILFGLGTALLDLGDNEAAAEALQQAVAHAPRDPQAYNNLGNAQAALGQTEAGLASYRQAIALAPGYGEALANLGLALEAAGDTQEAMRALRAAVAAEPDRGALREALARVLMGLDRWEEAEPETRAVLAEKPGSLAALLALGQCLTRLGRIEEALSLHRRATAIAPEDATARFLLGICQQIGGDFEAARESLERTITLRPDHGQAHYSLALIRGKDAPATERTRLETLLADPELPDSERSHIAFALARLLERGGSPDDAFAAYAKANALRFAVHPFDIEGHETLVDRLIETFNAAFFAQRRDFGSPSQRPVFIVGMPRCGSTLTEQILASHPEVHGAGELNYVRALVQDLPGLVGVGEPYPACAAKMTAAQSRRLAETHLGKLEACDPGAARVVDKMLGNYLRLGLIALMFPNATVVHCHRDPVDTCLSCFFQDFGSGLRFSYDLRALGVAYRAYRRIMEHWKAVLPLTLVEVGYEDLVEEPEPVVRRLLAACGLEWDARCLEFHTSERAVATSSVWQVRQPLYRSSVERWRRYEAHLGPLFDALGELAPKADRP